MFWERTAHPCPETQKAKIITFLNIISRKSFFSIIFLHILTFSSITNQATAITKN